MVAVDARHLTHVPTPTIAAPYTVLHGRVPITLITSTTDATVLQFGAFTDTTATRPNYLRQIGVQGFGVNTPGNIENAYTDPIVGNVPYGAATLSLHALTVSVQCTSSATVASGLFYMGTLPGRVRRTSYALFNDMAFALLQRREVTATSAYQSLCHPVVHHCYPADVTEWSEFQELAAPNAVFAANEVRDTLSSICAVFPPTAVANTFTVTVHTEWRVFYNNDPVLTSTASLRRPAPLSSWNSVIAQAASAFGRHREAIAGVAAVAGALLAPEAEALGAAGLVMGGRRGMRALGDVAR
jgi:hypothetical protein